MTLEHPESKYLPIHWAAYNDDDELIKHMFEEIGDDVI